MALFSGKGRGGAYWRKWVTGDMLWKGTPCPPPFPTSPPISWLSWASSLLCHRLLLPWCALPPAHSGAPSYGCPPLNCCSRMPHGGRHTGFPGLSLPDQASGDHHPLEVPTPQTFRVCFWENLPWNDVSNNLNLKLAFCICLCLPQSLCRNPTNVITLLNQALGRCWSPVASLSPVGFVSLSKKASESYVGYQKILIVGVLCKHEGRPSLDLISSHALCLDFTASITGFLPCGLLAPSWYPKVSKTD